MARAVSLSIVNDDRNRARDHRTSSEVLEVAAHEAAKAREVAARLRTMSALYQARLEGDRSPRRGGRFPL